MGRLVLHLLQAGRPNYVQLLAQRFLMTSEAQRVSQVGWEAKATAFPGVASRPRQRHALCVIFFVLLSSVINANVGLASPASPVLTMLIERAEQQVLHEDPVWLALLQMDRGALGLRRTSSAAAGHFFLASNGRSDSRTELAATLEGFLDPQASVINTASEQGDADVQHPQCAFIARRTFLVNRLAIGEAEMPRVDCTHYRNWRDGLGATGLTLIYPEGFMNNPASMFGHTLLRIDVEAPERGQEILGYSVDFTGEPGEDTGVVFILKGILGLYPGRFGIHPYYQQLRRYAEWENRDIWEYRLSTSEAELDLLLMHLWELRGVDHPYFFFTENCSYHLFRLLEAANPDLRSRDMLATFVIPIDTVRSALDSPGLVEGIRYRPSPATRLKADLTRLTLRQRALARGLAGEDVTVDDLELVSLAASERAATLDVAYEMLRYSFVQGSRDQAKSQGLARRLLLARSKIVIDVPGSNETPALPEPSIRPDLGHASSSAAITGGYRDDEAYIDLAFRPAFHGLMDRAGGYPRHMQIRFFDLNLRYFPERKRVRLEKLTLLEAISLSPRGEIFRPVAWSVSAGLATRRTKESGGLEDAAIGRVDMGGGVAFEPKSWLHVYGLATGTLDAGPGLRRDVSLAPGVRGGLFFTTPKDFSRTHFFADYRAYVLGDKALRLRTGVAQRFVTSRNTALLAEGTYNRIEGRGYWQGELSLQVHF